MTQNTLFTAFIATVEYITYALGEHDPGSAQDWRTSSDMRSLHHSKMYHMICGFVLLVASWCDYPASCNFVIGIPIIMILIGSMMIV